MFPLPQYPNLLKSARLLPGVGPQLENRLRQRGLNTVRDLLSLMPVRYQDRRAQTPMNRLTAGLEALCAGRIVSLQEKFIPGHGRRAFEIKVSDNSGELSAIWFRLPAPLRKTFHKNDQVLLFGPVSDFRGRPNMLHPEIKPWHEKNHLEPEIRPVYPELEGVKPGVLRKIMRQAALELTHAPAVFPLSWLETRGLTDPLRSLETLHNPPGQAPGPLPKPDESKAWKNLALFELLFIQLHLARFRHRLKSEPGVAFPLKSTLNDEFLAGLPFKLTASQKKALMEIRRDMARPEPMNRLLQGDVGSGKTVTALAAAMTCVAGGCQAAFMAPTEILARQHFENMRPYALAAGLKIGLLTGDMPESEKKALREALASNSLQIIFGTHALLSDKVAFARLGLVIIDEQHRFGVAQRLALKSKAARPDVLVMSATPIPRTLALTLYGDLDISSITEMPPGRLPVQTRLFPSSDRPSAYRWLKEAISRGGQAFVVAPRIEARPDQAEPGDDLASAEELYRYISEEVLPDTRATLIHGRMPPEEQRAALDSFQTGHSRVLVSTTIIEVGVDVESVSMIVIEGADRFGLAQLHQLRGRVGRGRNRSACLLISSQTGGPAWERLEMMTRTNDGFVLAETDLALRGPGDAAGLKQSGLPPLTWASLPRDIDLLKKARNLAAEIIEQDPELAAPEFRMVREVIDQMSGQLKPDVSELG